MAITDWQESYSVKVKLLDQQHRSLLSLINTFALEQDGDFDQKHYAASINKLLHYAYTHFATEERYLTNAHYPELESHILMHTRFIMKMLDLALKIEHGHQDERKELQDFLQNWFCSHVLGEDRKYIHCLALKSKHKGKKK